MPSDFTRVVLTDAQRAELVRLLLAGVGNPEIARRLGVSRQFVGRQRARKGEPSARPGPAPRVPYEGFEAEFRRLSAAGLGGRAIGQRFGIHETTVRTWRRRFDITPLPPGAQTTSSGTWTPGRDAVLREMLAAGATDRDIGRRLGIPGKHVRNRRIQKGLLNNSAPPGELGRLVSYRHSAPALAARAAGWSLPLPGFPAGLRPIEYRVLLALLDGPATAPQLSVATGGRNLRSRRGRHRSTPPLRSLESAGLVVAVPLPTGRPGGRHRVFMLTEPALSMFEAAAAALTREAI